MARAYDDAGHAELQRPGGSAVNYWPRWINAITNATAHLTLAQMGAYDRLLDHAYKTEQPLPGNLDACCRIVRATTKADREAVAAVLTEFWALQESGYEQQRVLEELAIAKPKIDAARLNGKGGGRPRKNPAASDGKPSGFQAATQDEPKPKAPHPQSSTPSGIEPQANACAAHASAEGPEPAPEPTAAGAVCLALKAAGIGNVTPHNQRLQALIAAGAQPGEFVQFAPKALEVAPAQAFAYVVGAVEGERKRALAAGPMHKGPLRVAGGRHSFAAKDYREGINEDGSIAN